MSKRKIIGVILVVVVIIVAYKLINFNKAENNTLTLYGNVDIRTVNLGFRVSGKLAELNVDEGATIKKGELLGKLDDAPYINAVNQTKANVAMQQAKLNLLQEGYRQEDIKQAESFVLQQQAAFDYANQFYHRQLGLWNSKVIAADQLEDAHNKQKQAEAALNVAKEKLTLLLNGPRAQEIVEAEAALAQAQAALDQAKLNLQDTSLYSPSDGIILTRAIEPGSILSSNNTVFTLSLIRPVWIRAYVDEANLGKVIPGKDVTVYSDSQPDKAYKATIGFISPTAEFTPKTVESPELRTDLVYRLRLIISDPDDALRQGMPVTIKVTP